MSDVPINPRARIHPTTLIEGDVELADGVEIGPWCCLKGPIRIAPGTKLLRRVELYGPLTIGEGNVFYPNTCIGFAPQDIKFDAGRPGVGVVIADRNVFREGVTVHRATHEQPTTIGSDNYFMVNAHVAHDCVVADRCTLANSALLAGHVTLEDNVTIGGNGAVHQFCRVGRLAMLSGAVAVVKDLPPFCVTYEIRTVSSLNLVGLRRAGLHGHIDTLRKAFDVLYRRGHALPNALARIEREFGDNPLCLELVRFCRSSKRGITQYGGRSSRDEQQASGRAEADRP